MNYKRIYQTYRIKIDLFYFLHYFICLADALSRSENHRSDVEVDLNKERSESAALRDLLCKVQALNEGLAQDKIELNKIILLVSMLF